MATPDAPDAPLNPQQPPAAADETIRHNARVGTIFFLVYLLLYGGFIAITAWDIKLMAIPVIGRINLAIVYGLFLIAAAFVMALLYMRLCRNSQQRIGKN